MPLSYRCWAEIDLDALRANLAWIRHRVGAKVKIMAVVKADAYGHGLKQIAAHLMQSGTDIFGVANLAEARAIRGVGKGWPILLLGACLPDEIDAVVKEEIMPTISCLEEAIRFSKSAARFNRSIQVHLKVDTGMGRLGSKPQETPQLIRDIAAVPHLQLCGLYTHFASVEDNAQFSATQRRTFQKVLSAWPLTQPQPVFIHANNSGGLLFERESIYNTIRPGLLIYGIIPVAKRRAEKILEENIRATLSWKCRVGFVKKIQKGTTVSYARSYRARKETLVATLTAGYGDGYLRSGSNRAEVLIGGQSCAVVGRITMDQMMIDVTGVPYVQPGDEAVLIGRQGTSEITAKDVARWCGTIPWEVLTNINHRVPRVYRGGVAA